MAIVINLIVIGASAAPVADATTKNTLHPQDGAVSA
jgi:hypothetical protein